MDIYKQKTENVMPHLSVISINGYVGGRQTVGVANYFLDQSIGIDETNIFQLAFFLALKL